METVLWSYEWGDGSRLELVDSPDAFVLYEYDAEGTLVKYSYRDGYSLDWADSVSYPKSRFKLEQAIADIEDEYEL